MKRRGFLKGLLTAPVVGATLRAEDLPEPKCPKHKDAFDRADGVVSPTVGLVRIARTHGFHQHVSVQVFETKYDWVECDLCGEFHPMEQRSVPGYKADRMTVADYHEVQGQGSPSEFGCCIFVPLGGWDCNVQIIEHDLDWYHESKVITMEDINADDNCFTIDLRGFGI